MPEQVIIGKLNKFMKIFSPNNLNSKKFVGFKGIKAPNYRYNAALKNFINKNLNGYENALINSIEKKAPDLIETINGNKFLKNESYAQKGINYLKSFLGLPLDAMVFLSEKIPKLGNLEIIKKHKIAQTLENETNALKGLYSKTAKTVKAKSGNLENFSFDKTDKNYEKIKRQIQKEYKNSLGRTMSENTAFYDTKKERISTRLISGFTASLFLGSDFYNKAVQKGKNKKEAKKEQRLKQGQEIKETLYESVAQYGIFSCFSKFVNSNVWAPAIIGAGIGLVSRVLSRLTSGMPIRRIKPNPEEKINFTSIDDYVKSAKSKDYTKINEQIIKKPTDKKAKEPFLSLKNILKFCGFSILLGCSGNLIKNYTNIGKKFSDQIETYKNKLIRENKYDIYSTLKQLKNIEKSLEFANEKEIAKDIESLIQTTKDKNKIFIGQEDKKVNLFGKIPVHKNSLQKLITAPFRFVKELIFYPYKIAAKFGNALKNSKLFKKIKSSKAFEKLASLNKKAKQTSSKKTVEITEGQKQYIQNLFKRYCEFEKKYNGDDAKIQQEFSEYIKKARLLSSNEITSSKGDNSKIAVIAQTLGTLTGMWFNMNDEFNASIRNGSKEETAQKEARLRGINKFFRMTVQVIISGSLNEIFAKQYNSSIASSAVIVAISTFLTDSAARLLTGMPSKKMTKEELEQYQKEHKEGIMSWYYKLIDKLAS